MFLIQHPSVLSSLLKLTSMNQTSKLLLTALAAIIAIAILLGAIRAIDGGFLNSASFITSALAGLAIIAVFYLLYKGVRSIWKLCIVGLVITFQACSYAKSNQQVVVSTDCGMSWKAINAGDAVPKGVGNRCFMKVVMPNYPMQGQSVFVANLLNKVRVKLNIDYDYSITSPLNFIKEAKYLGRANADADDDGALNPASFEGAENSVIDVRLRDVSKNLLVGEDIVDADISALEGRIFEAANKVLASRGVQLNFITLTFDLDEQTRQSIDVATAMRIYQANGLEEVGKQVMAARAGATKITVENKPAPVTQE